MIGLGIIAPELCEPYIQMQPEQPSLFLIPAKPTIWSKPVAVTETTGFWCAINRWITENPILAGAGLLGGYFLLRSKR